MRMILALALFALSCHGLPDFMPNSEHLQNTLSIDYIDADADSCLINEKCLGGPGIRTVLRFATMVHNIGTTDAKLGNPPTNKSDPLNPPYWHFDQCHKQVLTNTRHWHFSAYADYELLANDKRTLILQGHKNGFCLEDVICDNGKPLKYNCENQGIQAGCRDLYDDSLPCQWIDITDLPATANYSETGTYYLRVTVNKNGFFPEISTRNNVALAKVVLADVPKRLSPLNQPWYARGEGANIPPPGGL